MTDIKEDVIWMNKIICHLPYDEVHENRKKYRFRPCVEERNKESHSNFLYQVEWEKFDGTTVRMWEPESLLELTCALREYKERLFVEGEESTIVRKKYEWTPSPDHQMEEMESDESYYTETEVPFGEDARSEEDEEESDDDEENDDEEMESQNSGDESYTRSPNNGEGLSD